MTDLETRYLIDIIKDRIDSELLLKSLGFSVYRKTYRELRSPCIIHGGNNKTAFRFNVQTKKFICYTKGCHCDGGSIQNDIIWLVRKVKNLSFIDSLQYLASFVGINIDETNHLVGNEETIHSIYLNKKIDDLVRETNIIKNDKISKEIDESLIQEYKKARGDYFTKKGISESLQDFFDVGYYIDCYGEKRVSIPIRDIDGRVVGISGRRVANDSEPRYLLTKNFDKGKYLYNLNEAKKYVNHYREVAIVVEGFKATWSIFECGFKNVVACMGTSFSDYHASLLAKAGFTKCLLCFDGDDSGKKATENAVSISSRYMKVRSVDLFKAFPGMSPDDFDCDTLYCILDSFLKEF